MAELIDIQALLAYLAEIKPDEYVSAFGEAAVQVIGLIEEFVKEMPTIEAEPVRHGRWKKKNGEIYCTNCKKSKWSESFELMLSWFNFCPLCGARMDGGAENDER